jgi:AraC-like DNA-binding protein
MEPMAEAQLPQQLQQWSFPPGPQDEAWGLYVTAIGSGDGTLAGPASGWRLHYLVRGSALLTVPGRRRQRVEAGDVVLLDGARGGLLSPDPQRCCRIHHLDFGGAWMERWVEAGFFGSLPRVVRAGFDESLLGLVAKLAALARNPPPGAGRLLAGILGDLLARLEWAGRAGAGAGGRELVREARRLLEDPERDRLGLEAAAEELGVSYSWFRRSFRAQMGMAPQRFRLLQRLDRACQLLGDTSLPVGEIARRLGFSSQAYFARMFRKEMGLTPSLWRARQPGQHRR